LEKLLFWLRNGMIINITNELAKSPKVNTDLCIVFLNQIKYI
jgi:hypothetical protein